MNLLEHIFRKRTPADFIQSVATAAILTLVCANRGIGESAYLNKGIESYNRGDYNDAMGMFGAAKATESDNPTLHYYMANCLVRLGAKADAIREYKMALAISPTGQIAKYCTEALQSLNALPAVPTEPAALDRTTARSMPPTMPARMAGQDNPYRYGRPKSLEVSQQPQLVSVLCGCPLCRRVDMILTDLHTNFGDKISFTRTMQNAADQKTQQILTKYNITKCPTILLFDSHGELAHTYTGVVSEPDLTRDVDLLAKTSPTSQFASPQDAHLASIRNAVVSEVDARVAADQIRVDEEISQIQNEMQDQITDLPRYRQYRGSHRKVWADDHSQDIADIQASGNARIKVIQDEWERKKRDWYKAAEDKIQALQSTQSSVAPR